MKPSRSPWLYIIWVGVSGVVFAVAFGMNLYFSLTDYGFLYNGALAWVYRGGFISLMACVNLWLFRSNRLRYFVRTGILITSLSFIAMSFFVSAFIAFGGQTFTGAGRITGSRHYLHNSPQGTNRFVIMFTGMDEDSIYAYPMLNRWIYWEADNGFVWEAHVHEDEYTVEWPSERQAIVEVTRRYSKQIIDGMNEDGRIIVEFDQYG